MSKIQKNQQNKKMYIFVVYFNRCIEYFSKVISSNYGKKYHFFVVSDGNSVIVCPRKSEDKQKRFLFVIGGT